MKRESTQKAFDDLFEKCKYCKGHRRKGEPDSEIGHNRRACNHHPNKKRPIPRKPFRTEVVNVPTIYIYLDNTNRRFTMGKLFDILIGLEETDGYTNAITINDPDLEMRLEEFGACDRTTSGANFEGPNRERLYNKLMKQMQGLPKLPKPAPSPSVKMTNEER